MSHRERMSSVDTAWLRMDRPNNLMMIVGVLTTASPVTLRSIRRIVTERMLTFRRFRERPVEEPGGAVWVEDARFRVERHVVRLRLGPGEPETALKARVAALATTPLDPERPLWEIALVERHRGGSAIIARFHHCYADGIALIGVMLSLTDPTREASLAPRPVPAREPAASSSVPVAAPAASPLAQLFEPLGDALGAVARVSGNVLERAAAVVQNPAEWIDFARVGAAIAAEVAQLALMADDTPTRFKGVPGTEKRVAWTDPLPLEEVKAVGRALHCSVNDVLLACVAGALRGYLAREGEVAEDVELRAMIPVNLRPPGKEGRLGNRFGLVALVLPVGMSNPLARLHALRARMNALKRSYQAPLTLGILGLVGICPKPVQEQVLDLLASKATAVMTNVPGPQQPLYIAGAELDSMMFWVPQSGNIGMGVSILSYNGKVQFGLITDGGLTPDPEAIVARFGAEFERLVLAVLMEPWGTLRDPELVDRELARAEGTLNRPDFPSRARRRAAPSRRPA